MELILLLEDEPNLGETLKDYFSELNYNVIWCKNLNQAKEFATASKFNFLLVDLSLPDGNGFEFYLWFKNTCGHCPVIFISAENDPETRLQGLQLGAFDYMAKPFSLKELHLKMLRAMKFRDTYHQKEEIQIGKLKIWFDRFQLLDGTGQVLNMGQKEMNILSLLWERRPSVVARDEMIQSIWGEDAYPSNRTVDNYIVRLRKWAESDPSQQLKISSVRGVGYKLITAEHTSHEQGNNS